MYNKVLVPLDGSELAECALSPVKYFVKDRSLGELILLSVVVVEFPWADFSETNAGFGGIFDYEAFRNARLKQAKKYLAEVQTHLSSEGINVKTELIEAKAPAPAIAEYAQTHNVDLIVIASHGYTGMKKMLMGSVALRVLNESQVPVLLIKPQLCKISPE
jgi:nucleotide-binding universal stress UspA family protein